MLRKLAAGTGAALVAAGLATAPAVASRLPTPPEAVSSGGGPPYPQACGDVAPAGQSGLEKLTTPADGSLVEPGDTIGVTLRWGDGALEGSILDRALDCVEIDGRPAPGLDLDRRQVPNDGEVTHPYRIPGGLAPGTEVCDQGFVFGPLADGPQRLSSNRVCFTVAPGGAGGAGGTGSGGAPPESGPGPTGPGGPGGSGLPPSGGSGPGGPGSPGPGLPTGGGGRGPSGETSPGIPPTSAPPPAPAGPAPTSSPAELAGPAESGRVPAGGPGEEAPPRLPRTGPEARPLAAVGGANLIAAGLALIGGARRRRPSQPRHSPEPPD